MKPIVTFGIPIAPKCRIDYWDKAMDNLNRTLNSIENQTVKDYLIVAVKETNDKLRLDKKYRNLVILNRRGKLKEFSEDKDERTLMAMKYHYANNGQYFFRLDWDDLIHKELVEFIGENSLNDGWVVIKGYFYNPSNQTVIPFDNYWMQCGSAFAVNYEADECKEGPKDGFHHQRIPIYRKNLGKPLAVIPFFAGMYTVHGDNISTPKHKRILKKAAWKPVQTIEGLAENFGLAQE